MPDLQVFCILFASLFASHVPAAGDASRTRNLRSPKEPVSLQALGLGGWSSTIIRNPLPREEIMPLVPVTHQSWLFSPPLELPLQPRLENGRFDSLRRRALADPPECNTTQIILAGQDLEVRIIGAMPKCSLPTAEGAIALDDGS